MSRAKGSPSSLRQIAIVVRGFDYAMRISGQARSVHRGTESLTPINGSRRAAGESSGRAAPQADAVDECVFRGRLISIGRFRCGPEQPRWDREDRIRSGHLIVFPRTFVRITHAGSSPIVATPNQVMYYNADQTYRRQLISRRGDLCEWFSIRHDVLQDAIAPFDPAVVERPGSPFRFDHGPCNSAAYFVQRLLYRHVTCGVRVDEPAVEETALKLLGASLSRTSRRYANPGRRERPARARASMQHRQLAEAAKEFLATRYHQQIRLDDIADAVQSSVFHLCRIFRSAGRRIRAGPLRMHRRCRRSGL